MVCLKFIPVIIKYKEEEILNEYKLRREEK
jgi:hypothetical protein